MNVSPPPSASLQVASAGSLAGLGLGRSAAATSAYQRAPYISKLESIASSAVRAADRVGASLIVVYTHTGKTAQLVAKYRPPMPILTLVVPHLVSDQLKWKLEGRWVGGRRWWREGGCWAAGACSVVWKGVEWCGGATVCTGRSAVGRVLSSSPGTHAAQERGALLAWRFSLSPCDAHTFLPCAPPRPPRRSSARQCLISRALLPVLAAPSPSGDQLLQEAVAMAGRVKLVKPHDHVVCVQRIHDDFCVKIISVDDMGAGRPGAEGGEGGRGKGLRGTALWRGWNAWGAFGGDATTAYASKLFVC